MANIRILPENLSNMIAAGEVVERPASVVKELVENALDAGSQRIFIDVENGGRGLIQVADNGSGMSHDDALLSIERYATSKIAKDPDLFAIKTLGFRGEALPSIAAVSHFSLTTRTASADTGAFIKITGGRIERVSEIGAPVGTLISVRRLFFNTPARRKFLKTIATEMGHIVETVSAMALGWPQVQMRLQHNNKCLKSWPKASPDERVADVLGSRLHQDLVAVADKGENVAVKGWIGAPRITRSTSRGIYLFVNGRFVRDRMLQHAIFAGYAGRLLKGQYPVAVIWIQVPYDQVDVNVHPSKHEVRFARQKKVHQVLADAVGQALSGIQLTGWYGDNREAPTAPVYGKVAEPPSRFNDQPSPQPTRHSSKPPNVSSENKVATVKIDDLPGGEDAAQPNPPIRSESASFSQLSMAKTHAADHASVKPVQDPIWEAKKFSDLRMIGQFHDTYLICEGSDGLVLIDQHAAHERITYEKLKKDMETQKQASQHLLLPETIELGFRETQILTRMVPELKRLGLEIEPFGGSTFVVTAVPELLSQRHIGPLIEALVERIADVGFGDGLQALMDQCLMVVACHSTIRANQSLSPQQCQALLAQLDNCEHPSHCPHGRPTWIQWRLKAVQKAFNRII